MGIFDHHHGPGNGEDPDGSGHDHGTIAPDPFLAEAFTRGFGKGTKFGIRLGLRIAVAHRRRDRTAVRDLLIGTGLSPRDIGLSDEVEG